MAEPVRLVLLGGASAAPVCDGDVCYLPDAAADLAEPTTTEPTTAEPTTAEPDDQRGA